MGKNDQPCIVENCPTKAFARKLCPKHYNRLRKRGDIHNVARLRGVGATPAERFWSRVAVTANADKCWLWMGLRDVDGYGRLTVGSTRTKAHRFAFFLAKGYWPEPMCLHSCDNPPCCNPAHLSAGTSRDNMLDMVAKGRHYKHRKA